MRSSDSPYKTTEGERDNNELTAHGHAQMQGSAVQFWISYEFTPPDRSGGGRMTSFAMDLGVFLASRGPYAWLGYGWMGCGCGWDGDGKMPCDLYERPEAFNVDYGTPTELCHEDREGVFVRDWTKATVTVHSGMGGGAIFLQATVCSITNDPYKVKRPDFLRKNNLMAHG
jgi:hypothetical protein